MVGEIEGWRRGAAEVGVACVGGDSDDSWGTVGRAGAILDNLIAAGKAAPMMIVMPAGHISTDFRLTPGVRMGHDAFNDDLTKVVLPFIDANYRTVADRDHRAIAGRMNSAKMHLVCRQADGESDGLRQVRFDVDHR